MKRVFIFLCLAFAAAATLSADVVLSEEEQEFVKSHPVITVQNERDYIPVNFNDNGVAKGYSIDFINLVAQKVGLEVEVVGGKNWQEYLDMVQRQELDVLLNAVKNQERSRYMHFTTPYLQLYPSIFSRDGSQLSSIESLYGKVLAVPAGYYFIPYFQKNHPKITILLTRDNLDSLQAVATKKADAAIGLAYTMQQLILDNFIEGIGISGIADIEELENHFERLGVRSDMPLLRDILQKGIDSVTYEERNSLKKKWLEFARIDPIEKEVGFTELEKQYLEQKQQIRMCVDPEWMPFESIKGGKHYGMSADYFELIEQKLPIPIKLVPTENWSQSLEYIKDRRCDILSLAMATPQRKKYMDFTAPYLQIPLVIATQNDKFFINDLGALKGKKVGIVKGYAYLELLQNRYPQLELVPVDSVKDGLNKVLHSELFGFIDTLATIGYIFQKEYIGELKIAGKFEQTWDLGVAVRNDHKQLLHIFDKVLLTITPRQKQEILNRWVSINYEQPLDIKYIYQGVAVAAVIILFLLYRQYTLKEYNRKLRYLSTHDNLTGVYNRMHLDRLLDVELERAKRYDEPFCIIVFDVDDFKYINDTHGHQAGDKLLVQLVQIIRDNIRKTDILGRWGGEEFLLICPFSKEEQARVLAQKLLKKVRENCRIEGDGVTMSGGIASFRKGENEKILFARADKALYEAKKNGKNRVVISS